MMTQARRMGGRLIWLFFASCAFAQQHINNNIYTCGSTDTLLGNESIISLSLSVQGSIIPRIFGDYITTSTATLPEDDETNLRASTLLANHALLLLAAHNVSAAMTTTSLLTHIDTEAAIAAGEGGLPFALKSHLAAMEALVAVRGLNPDEQSAAQNLFAAVGNVDTACESRGTEWRLLCARHLKISAALYSREGRAHLLRDDDALLIQTDTVVDFFAMCVRVRGKRPGICNRRASTDRDADVFQSALRRALLEGYRKLIAFRSSSLHKWLPDDEEAGSNAIEDSRIAAKKLMQYHRSVSRLAVDAAGREKAKRSAVACRKAYQAFNGFSLTSAASMAPPTHHQHGGSTLRCDARSFTFPSASMWCTCEHCSVEALTAPELPAYRRALQRHVPLNAFDAATSWPAVVVNVHAHRDDAAASAVRAARAVARAGRVVRRAATALSFGVDSPEARQLAVAERGAQAKNSSDDFFLLSQSYFYGRSASGRGWTTGGLNERMFGRIVSDRPFDNATCARFIERPAWIFQTADYALRNIWHTLHDFLFPVFLAAHDDGDDAPPSVDRDRRPVIILAIGSTKSDFDFSESIGRLHEHATNSSFSHMLFFLGGYDPPAIFSKGSLERLRGRTCFRELHTGVDVGLMPHQFSALKWTHKLLRNYIEGRSATPARATSEFEEELYEVGYEGIIPLPNTEQAAMMAECIDVNTPIGRRMKRSQMQFNAFLLNKLGMTRRTWRSDAPANVMFVERKHNRRWANLPGLMELAREVLKDRAGSVRSMVLEETPFREQVAALQNISVLVVAGGAGAVNTMFLPRRSAVVMVFTAGYESMRCVHANTALASGVHALVHRPRGVDAMGNGLHPGAPLVPNVPVISRRRRGKRKWRALKMNPSYSCNGQRKADLSNCVRTDSQSFVPEDWPPKSPPFIAVPNMELFGALMHSAIKTVGQSPVTFHA